MVILIPKIYIYYYLKIFSMNNFSKRILSGVIYVCIFLFAILFSEKTYIGLITFFSIVSLWEFSKILKVNNVLPYMVLIGLSVIAFIGFDNYIPNKILLLLVVYTIFNATILLIDLFSEGFKTRSKLSILFLQIKYVVLSFFFLMILPFYKGGYHSGIVIYIILMIWTNDSFAFLVGKNFGKRKLFERVSPKKTIEGFLGGVFFTMLLGVGLGYFSKEFSMLNWVIIAVIVSVFGTLGDLVESKFKRQANIKDSGTIMPGHGGLLDRLDSLFFLAPFVYLYVHFLM